MIEHCRSVLASQPHKQSHSHRITSMQTFLHEKLEQIKYGKVKHASQLTLKQHLASCHVSMHSQRKKDNFNLLSFFLSHCHMDVFCAWGINKLNLQCSSILVHTFNHSFLLLDCTYLKKFILQSNPFNLLYDHYNI